MEFSPKPIARSIRAEWPHAAGVIRMVYQKRVETMYAMGASPHQNLFKATICEDPPGIALQTAFGEVISDLTFYAAADGALRGRVLFYRPEVKAIGRKARPVFSLTIDDDRIYTGDTLEGQWAWAWDREYYSWSTVQEFMVQLMAAVVADEPAPAQSTQ